MTNHGQKNSTPLPQTMTALSPDEVRLRSQDLPGWQLSDDQCITRTYRFESYLGALSLLNAIATFAEELNHHPALSLDYKKLTVSWTTHDIGGLHDKDFSCAQRCDALFADQGK